MRPFLFLNFLFSIVKSEGKNLPERSLRIFFCLHWSEKLHPSSSEPHMALEGASTLQRVALKLTM